MTGEFLKFAMIILISLSIASCGHAPDPIDIALRSLDANANAYLKSVIAFSGNLPDSQNIYGYNREIFIMTPNGNFSKRMTFDPGDDDYPAFSPDGRQLAFVSNRSSGGYGSHDIFRMDALGNVFQLTDETWQFDSSATDWGPGYITAAQHNTLVGAPFDVGRVVKVHPKGLWEDFIDTGHIMSYDPTISRDGKSLAFCARPIGTTYFDDIELYLRTEEAPGSYRLTYFGDEFDNFDKLIFTTNPQFDKTGYKIIFQTNYWDDNLEIGYVDLSTCNVTPIPIRLTNNPADDVEPCWNPAGTGFAWCSNRDGNFEIYSAPLMNTGEPPGDAVIKRLTYTEEDESNPDWANICPISKNSTY